MRKWLLSLIMLLPCLTAGAQESSDDIKYLTQEMYRLYPHRESPKEFLDVTDRLKKAALTAGDERTFYKAWGNQATYSFSAVSRDRGLEMAKEMKEYAQKHNEHFGMYASMSINASMLSTLHLYDQATKSFEDAIQYLHRYYPDESAASSYLGLAKIYINQKKPEKVRECARKALDEPNLIAQHRLSAWSYMCMSYTTTFKDKEQNRDDFNHCYAEREKAKAAFGHEDDFGPSIAFDHAMINDHYQDALIVTDSFKSPIDKYMRRSLVYETLGDYETALYDYQHYYKLRDSINSVEIQTQASEYAVQLGVAKAELEAQKSAEQVHHVFMFMLGLLAVIVISALSFILHRRNKHAKELSKAYDELGDAYDKLGDAYSKLKATTAAKERIESELRIARDIQKSMLPRDFSSIPEQAGIDLFALMNPAKEVGGDLYDYFIQGSKLYVCVGDVCGKGVPASMTMAVAVNLFRNVAKEGFPPEYIATRLNDTLTEGNGSGMFVTMFIAVINLATGRMDFCNAGHNPPLIIDPPLTRHEPCRPSFMQMESNAPIGLWPEIEFKGESIANVSGRTLFIYSDGVTETENAAHEQFGEKRLADFFRTSPYSSAKEIINLMDSTLLSFSGDTDPSDDITMLCLRIR
ncbi:MAG: SpoIIE family protein phosphatase [Prevotella sp.]|nr:SpoIIE family protein phosphatase [Prevotella sp.]